LTEKSNRLKSGNLNSTSHFIIGTGNPLRREKTGNRRRILLREKMKSKKEKGSGTRKFGRRTRNSLLQKPLREREGGAGEQRGGTAGRSLE